MVKVSLTHFDLEYERYLTFFSCFASCGMNKTIAISQVETNVNQITKSLTDFDAGFELLANFNGVSKKLTPSFVMFSNNGVKAGLLEQVENGILNTKCKAVYLDETIDV